MSNSDFNIHCLSPNEVFHFESVLYQGGKGDVEHGLHVFMVIPWEKVTHPFGVSG